MAQTSWNKLVYYLQAFANAHLQIKEFKSDFEDEMHDWVNELENFPIMWVVPPTNQFDTNVGYYTFKVIVLDRLQEGRGNVTSVVSDAHLILNDLFKYFNESNVFDIDFNIGATGDSLNTPAMEELAGAEVFITAEVESIGDCQIPLDGIIPIPPGFICQDATVDLNGQHQLLIPSGETLAVSIQSIGGTVLLLTDQGLDVFSVQNATATIKNTLGNTLDTLSIEPEENQEYIAPDANYTVKNTDAQVQSSGVIPSGESLDITAQDATYVLKNSNDLTVGNGSIPSGINKDIFLDDINYNVFVNGVFNQSFTTAVYSNDDININA